MKQFWVVCIALLYSNINYAQNWNPLDSIRLSIQTKPSFSASLDSRHSYLRGKPIDIFGLRVGADYQKTAAYIGFYTTAFQDKTDNMYEYVYLSGIGEYRWFKNYRWFIAQTVQIGVGTGSLSFRNSNGTYDYQDPMIIPFETGLNATYRIWRFIGVSAGVGARFSLTPKSYFSASYYTFGACFYTDELSKGFEKLVNP